MVASAIKLITALVERLRDAISALGKAVLKQVFPKLKDKKIQVYSASGDCICALWAYCVSADDVIALAAAGMQDKVRTVLRNTTNYYGSFGDFAAPVRYSPVHSGSRYCKS